MTPTDWSLGIEARIRAFLSDGDAAERQYRESIDRLGRTRLRAELARSHLLYGEWLRRARRRVDARGELRTAYEMLDAMGIGAFAERARRELAATGETARKRTVETSGELTAREAQVARLARDGLSNPEIGTRLFISAHTVRYHLGKVFTKLGIRSRSQLDRALPGEPGYRSPLDRPLSRPRPRLATRTIQWRIRAQAVRSDHGRVITWLNTAIQMKFLVIDGLTVRFAQSEDHAPLLSPSPESLLAFEPMWARLAEHAHLVAIDLPGFGHSQRRDALLSPRAMGEFIIRAADACGLAAFTGFSTALLPQILTAVLIIAGVPATRPVSRRSTPKFSHDQASPRPKA